MEKHEETLKITILGNSNSGKTSLINAILDGKFSPSHFKTTNVTIEKKQVDRLPICIMDTPDLGQNPKFKMGLIYRDTQICIICIDLSRKSSLDEVDRFVESIDNVTRPNNPEILLVGTKVDLIDASEIQARKEKLEKKAQDFFCQSCFITSAKENTAIDTVQNKLETLVREIYNKKNAARVSSASENLSRRNSSRLSSTASNNNPSSNSISKREFNQAMVLFWQQHKHKIINGIIIGTFAMIAMTLTLVLPVAPLLASIGLIIPFTGLAFTATLAGIGAAVGFVAGSVAAGIKSGIEALVKFFQCKEKIGDKMDVAKVQQTPQTKNIRHILAPVLPTETNSDLPRNFSSPINIEPSKDGMQSKDRIVSQTVSSHKLSASP